MRRVLAHPHRRKDTQKAPTTAYWKEVLCINRSKEVDYLCFFVETIMDDFLEHLRQYKRVRHLCEDECEDGSWAEMTPSTKAKQIERAFFDKEPATNPWKAVCLSQPARLGEGNCH